MGKYADDSTSREQRDQRILAHVELYQLTIARVVCRLFFPSSQNSDREVAKKVCGDALAALVRAKRLVCHKFPNGEPYYALPTKTPPNSQTIDYDLGTLWLCCMERKRFYRLATADVRRLFATPPHHHVRHCLSNEVDGTVAYRLYFSSVDAKSSIVQTKKHLSESRNKYGLKNWVECGDYGFIICCESEQKSRDIADALTRSTTDGGALHEQARFIVATVPTSATIGAFLKRGGP